MKNQSFIYLYLATLALVPMEIHAYFGYPNERARDHEEERPFPAQDNSLFYNNPRHLQNPSKLQDQESDDSKPERDRRVNAQNDEGDYQAQGYRQQPTPFNQDKRRTPPVYDDSHDFEIRHEDYRDRH